jgi:hypothetical protein
VTGALDQISKHQYPEVKHQLKNEMFLGYNLGVIKATTGHYYLQNSAHNIMKWVHEERKRKQAWRNSILLTRLTFLTEA